MTAPLQYSKAVFVTEGIGGFEGATGAAPPSNLRIRTRASGSPAWRHARGM